MILFGILIFLIRLPNFYILPFHSGIFLVNNIVRILLLCIGVLLLFSFILRKEKTERLPKIGFSLLIIYFVSQSVSVFNVINLESFFLVYKDLLFAFLLFFVTYQITSKKNIGLFCKILLLVSIINISYQILFFFFPSFFYDLFSQIFNEKYFQFFSYQHNRGRFFGDSLDEAIIPLAFFYFLPSKSILKRILLLLTVGATVFVTTFANWRTKVLIFFFSTLSSLVIFIKAVKNQLLLIVLCILFFLFISDYISLRITGANIVDRLLFPDVQELQANRSRLDYWKEATEVGFTSPITGVGLGNYYDNLSEKSRITKRSSSFNRVNSFVLIDDPHNLFFSTFATTGLIGLISLTLLLSYYFITDYRLYKKRDLRANALILVFWSIFIYALFNPWMYFSYLMFFWLIRGMLEKYKYICCHENK